MLIETAPVGSAYSEAKRAVLSSRRRRDENGSPKIVFNSLEQLITSLYRAKTIAKERNNNQEAVLIITNKGNQIKLVKDEDFYECPTCGIIRGSPSKKFDAYSMLTVFYCRICEQRYQ